AAGEPRESEAHRRVGTRAGRRGGHLNGGGPWAGRARRGVVEPIGRQIREGASVGIRGGGGPGGVQDPGCTRGCREKAFAQDESEPYTSDGGPHVLSRHHGLLAGRPTKFSGRDRTPFLR